MAQRLSGKLISAPEYYIKYYCVIFWWRNFIAAAVLVTEQM